MHRLSLLAPILFCLAACQSTPTTPDAASITVPAQPEQVNEAPVAPAQPEYVEMNMITVNGKPREELTTRLLERQLGRPDSIAKGAVECGGVLDNLNKPDSEAGDFWYYGNTMYEVSGDQAILDVFDVTTGKFHGKVGQLVLNDKTTLEDVRRFFPESAKEADMPATGRSGEEMSIPFFYKGTPTDASLSLLFKKGRLQKVEFFFPC